MKIGCCIGLEYYDQLVNNGYQSITLAARDVASWSQEMLETAKGKLDAGPLNRISLNNFCPPELRLNGLQYCAKDVEDYTRRLVKNANYLGYKMIGIGAPKSRNLENGAEYQQAYEQLKEAVSIICDVAAEKNIDILMESVCGIECNMITTTREVLSFIKAVNRKNLHLVYDIYHEYAEHQPLSVIDEAADEIRVVHIAQLRENKRYYLGEEHIPEYEQYWNRLNNIGYRGEWNLECFEGDPAIELKKSMQIMKTVIDNGLQIANNTQQRR